MSIRILCCSGSLEGGGSERQLWQLVSHLDRERFEPLVYLLHRKGVYLDKLPEDVSVFDFWSNSSLNPSGTRVPGRIFLDQVKNLGTLLDDLSVELVYDRTFHMTLVTAHASQMRRMPYVSTIVSPPSRDFASSGERFSFFKKWLLGRAYRHRLCTPIAVSSDVAGDASGFYKIARERIRVLPSPVDMDAVQAASEESHSAGDSKRREGCKDTCFQVVVVGRLSNEKGQETAIRAFARFLQLLETEGIDDAARNCALAIVGDGPDRSNLESLVRELEIQSNVEFHGFLENPYPLIRSSDLLLVPSRYEGLPNVVLEAMSLRTPVLATRCSQTLDELITGKNGRALGTLTDADDVEQMSEALVSTWKQRDTTKSQVDDAYRYVSDNHSLPTWMASMEELFLTIVDSSAKGSR